jgi:hypothetical protein
VDGRRYEAPDGVPVDLQPKLAIAALRCGAELAGAVDQVNGPSSREERASVSRFEASIIGEYWAREILKYAEHLRSGGLFCSHGSRLRTHGWTRLNVLRGAGLLSVDDIDFLFDEIGHRMGIELAHRRPEDYSERLLGAIKHIIRDQR